MNEPTASTLAINKLMLYLSPAPLKGWWGIVVSGSEAGLRVGSVRLLNIMLLWDIGLVPVA